MGPSKLLYAMSQVKMYPLGSAINFHGKIRMPMTPVMYPPILKSMRFGARLAKSFAGLTMLAAMFVASVLMATQIIATLTSNLLSKRPASTSGSQMVVP